MQDNHDPRAPENAPELQPDAPPQASAAPARRPRGFATLDREKVKEIARKGGKAAHAAGTAHEFTSEEARIAGRKGGTASHANRRKSNEAPPIGEQKS
jgi:general stress protein YciG